MSFLPASAAARRWLWIVLAILLVAGSATTLVLKALDENVSFYKTPSELAVMGPSDRHIRLGGMVEKGSIVQAGTATRFNVTDGVESITVMYDGLLPDLFGEEKGVVAEGRVTERGLVTADRLLAKHDENYMPPEVARAMKPPPSAQPLAK
ncbi:MAG: cytochrome c maturation protein CcmE [Bdellovibrionales bacterium]